MCAVVLCCGAALVEEPSASGEATVRLSVCPVNRNQRTKEKKKCGTYFLIAKARYLKKKNRIKSD